MPSTLAICVLLLGLTACLWLVMPLGRRAKGLPPGPPTLPILGNILQMPTRDSHLQFQKWAEEYGPIYSLIFGSQVLIVLSGHAVVKELLDRRSSIYSDRPDLYIAHTVSSNDRQPLMMRYGPQWRMIRRAYHGLLHISVARSYTPYQVLESKQMLRDIMDSPRKIQLSLQRYTNSLTTQMTYGWRTPSQDDPKLKELLDTVEDWSQVCNTGIAAFVDFFPALRSLPNFLVPIRARAQEIYKLQSQLYGSHWMAVKSAVESKTAKPCLCSDLAHLQAKEGFSDETAAYIAGAALVAGSDTTSAALYSFVEAMVLYPEVQRKARDQIDSVCGGQMPQMDDYDRLPYIRCCMKETLRWLPVAPHGAVPHAVTQDDNYMGYTIPKGAGVMNNVWTLEHDPTRFPDPHRFDPDRYQGDLGSFAETTTSPDVAVRGLFTFGAGRRVCQGMHVAERSMFLAISRLLWAFEFQPVEGKLPDASNVAQGFICLPQPFEVDVRVRAGKTEAITKAWEDAQTLLDGDGQWKEIPKGMDHLGRLEKEIAAAT